MQIIIPKSAGYVCIHRPLIFFIFFFKKVSDTVRSTDYESTVLMQPSTPFGP